MKDCKKIIKLILGINNEGKTFEEIKNIVDLIKPNLNVQQCLNKMVFKNELNLNSSLYTLNMNDRNNERNLDIPENWDALGFYNHVIGCWDTLCRESNIQNPTKYFNHENYTFPGIADRNSKEYLFIELVNHLQNRQFAKNVVKMGFNMKNTNYYTILNVLRNGNVTEFLAYFNGLEGTHNEKILQICGEMNIGQGKNAVQFVEGTLLIAEELSKPEYTDRNSIRTIFEPYRNNVKELYKQFKLRFNKGFKVALTLDFFKEYDSNVFNLCKPDTHIKRTVSLLTKDDYEAPGEEIDIDCVVIFLKMVDRINEKLQSEGKAPTTPYIY